jgi:hypothetical protein
MGYQQSILVLMVKDLTMPLNLNLFKRHKTSTFFISVYYIWIAFVIKFFSSGSADYPNSCGAANGGMIMLTGFIITAYSIVLGIKMILSKEASGEYGMLLGLIFIPLLIIILYTG